MFLSRNPPSSVIKKTPRECTGHWQSSESHFRLHYWQRLQVSTQWELDGKERYALSAFIGKRQSYPAHLRRVMLSEAMPLFWPYFQVQLLFLCLAVWPCHSIGPKAKRLKRWWSEMRWYASILFVNRQWLDFDNDILISLQVLLEWDLPSGPLVVGNTIVDQKQLDLR